MNEGILGGIVVVLILILIAYQKSWEKKMETALSFTSGRFYAVCLKEESGRAAVIICAVDEHRNITATRICTIYDDFYEDLCQNERKRKKYWKLIDTLNFYSGGIYNGDFKILDMSPKEFYEELKNEKT